MATQLTIRSYTSADRPWLCALLREHWGSERIVSRGKLHDAPALDGWIGWRGGERAGVLLYRLEERAAAAAAPVAVEIVLMHCLVLRAGIGSALLAHAVRWARQQRVGRLWLVTTNDNTGARAFYRARGFRLAATHRGAMARSRLLKPEIPESGCGGVLINDELEFELDLRSVT